MSDILTGFNMQGNDPIDDRIVSKSILETLEEYLKRVPVQKRYYGLTFFALDKDNKLRQYTFQTSLIEPTIDDSDDRLDKLQENIDNVDKDLQDHKNNKSIHKTSEEIRSEIVDADIPDSIARAQWVIQSIGVAIENIIAGASTDYDTLKKVQTKIEDLRSEMESQLYGDDGSGIFKTLEQVLGFLNQYKDFIVDIPNNFVSKTDIIDNLTTDDATKVLSARQGKILSETLTNYFDSAMQSIRSETDRATNAENRIEAKLDDEITRSTNKDENHDNRLTVLESKSHTQNTDLGTTSSTFQLKYNTGNKIKHESDAISVRNSADTDYVNFIAKNGTFKGDLLVEGKSFVTEAETVEIKDNLLLLNKGEVGSGVTKGMAGLEIDRGTEPNYQIVFDESDNRFKAGEIGDIQCLALRDGDDSMTDGMFTSWDSTTKRLKTTNIVPTGSSLFFGNSHNVGVRYSHNTTDGDRLSIDTNNKALILFTTNNYTNFRSDSNAFQFIGSLRSIGTNTSETFKRLSDNSEVLYHADLVNNLTTGGANKPLTAEQGKVLKSSIDGLNTEIGNVKDSYLPLSGGTMTGTITLNNGITLRGIGLDGNSRNLIGVVSNSNRVSVGATISPLTISSSNTAIIHTRGSSSYDIYDTYNLPDPAKLSADQTLTGTNNFTAGKFNVTGDKSKFSVNDVGGLRMYYDYAGDDAGISRYLDFYTKTSSDTDYTRRGIFGLYASKSTPNSDYAYIGAGDVGSADAQYRFYPNTLYIPETFYLRTITSRRQLIGVNNINNRVSFGDPLIPTWIISNNTDLFHSKYTNQSTHSEYKIWDESNLPSPASTTDLSKYALLAGDNTFTGSNTFNKTVSVVGSGTISLNPSTGINFRLVSTSAARGYSITLGTADDPHTTTFGSVLADSEYAYIAIPGTDYGSTPYRFLVDQMTVPNTFRLLTKEGILLLRKDSNGVQLGSGSSNTFVNSFNSDLTHRKYTASSTYTDYKIWDASNLPSPASSTDLANYLPLSGGNMSGNIVLDNSVVISGKEMDGTVSPIVFMSGSNILTIGSTANKNTILQTGAYDLLHNRAGTRYKFYDSYNLPNPVQTSDLADYVVKSDLDAYATKAELGDYATKQWVTDNFSGGGSGADLLPSDNTWSGTNTYGKNIILNNNISLASKKTDGSLMNIASINTSDVLALGNIGLDVKISSSYSDLIHKKSSGEYKIWDAYNVGSPLDYMKGIAGQVASVSGKEISINGVNQTHIVLGLGGNGITLFAPTTAGISGQVLQSQGAGKAPIWVDGGTGGGGVNLSDNNTWTGLNTFQGGLKTSDGTNSYDVWDKNNLKYVARITPSNLGYALSFYTTTAGWRDFDDLCINNLMPNASKTIEQGGAGFVGQYESAYASAEIKDIVTQNIFASGGKNLSNVSTGASFLGNESNAFKSAYIGEVNTNTVKSADGKSLLNFKTDGVYMIANSGTEYKLATLNDISGSGSSVSLDGNNTWTGVNIFSGTGMITNQYDSGNTEIPSSAKYSIRLACGGSYNEYGFGAVRSEDRVKQSYAFVQTPSAFFIFDNSGSLYTTIGSTKYEFWNKQNLAKPIIYNTNSDGDGILYKGDSTSNRINSLELVGILPPTNDAVSLSNGGTGGFGNINNAYAESYIGAMYTNEIRTFINNDMTTTVNLTMNNNGVYFTNANGTLYKLTMEAVS